jgi:hypothetical protein
MQLDLTNLPTPAELEQFYIPFRDGRPAARIGLRLDLYFRRLGELELRKALVTCIEHYLNLAGDRIKLCAFANDRQFRKLKPGQRVELERFRKMLNPEEDFNFEASASNEGYAEHWSMSIKSSQVTFREDELGYLIAYLPFTVLENAPPRSFTKLFLYYCNALAVEHAYGGMGWVLPFDVAGRNGALNLPGLGEQAWRFCALDVDDPTGTAIHCEHGIKSINWLTAVSTRLLERVGGADAVARAAGHEIVVHPFSNGAVFQAGEQPQIGDSYHGLIPPAYVALGKALKPLRAAYKDTLLYAPANYGPVPEGQSPNKVFTQRWLARFDGD